MLISVKMRTTEDSKEYNCKRTAKLYLRIRQDLMSIKKLFVEHAKISSYRGVR